MLITPPSVQPKKFIARGGGFSEFSWFYYNDDSISDRIFVSFPLLSFCNNTLLLECMACKSLCTIERHWSSFYLLTSVRQSVPLCQAST